MFTLPHDPSRIYLLRRRGATASEEVHRWHLDNLPGDSWSYPFISCIPLRVNKSSISPITICFLQQSTETVDNPVEKADTGRNP